MVRVGILGLTSCSGCQCELLNCQDAVLKLVESVEIAYFPLAQDRNELGNFDLLFVEGSVSSQKDLETLKRARESTKLLVAIGSCACYGGVQAQRNDEASLEEMLREVYGRVNLPVKPMKAKALKEVVQVDYELPGCPIDGRQFVYTVSSLLLGVKPFFPKLPVCHECKLAENECLLLKGKLCQGPVTYAGCGAPCTSTGVGCQGCRGDCDFPNYGEMLSLLRERGLSEEDALKFLKLFRGNFFNFRKERGVDEKGA
jgi:sulfhydrogenase subunit delta